MQRIVVIRIGRCRVCGCVFVMAGGGVVEMLVRQRMRVGELGRAQDR